MAQGVENLGSLMASGGTSVKQFLGKGPVQSYMVEALHRIQGFYSMLEP